MVNYFQLITNNPEYFKQFSCKDLLFLNYDCPVKVKRVAKWSEHNYIYYALSGKKTIHTPERSITLTGNSIVFVKKGACIVEQYFEEPFCIVVFIIPDDFIISFMKEYATGAEQVLPVSYGIMDIRDDVNMKSFYQSIIPYFALLENIPEEILEFKFKELLLCIIRNPANDEICNYFQTLRNQTNSSIKEIMEANYAYNLTLKDYAKLTCRSISSFKRDFQLLFKTTPGRWIIKKKLHRAKELLLQNNNSVSDIAMDSGFENTAHFCRLFKEKTGFSPLQYRRLAVAKEVVA